MGTRKHPRTDTVYFVTTTVRERRAVFREPRAAELLLRIISTVRSELSFALLAYSVMPDHLHLLLAPERGEDLSMIMKMIMGRFARAWNSDTERRGSLWQSRFYETAIWTDAQLRSCLEYVDWNAVKAGLAESPEAYPYSSARRGEETDLEDYLAGGLWAGDAGLKPGLPKEREVRR